MKGGETGTVISLYYVFLPLNARHGVVGVRNDVQVSVP